MLFQVDRHRHQIVVINGVNVFIKWLMSWKRRLSCNPANMELVFLPDGIPCILDNEFQRYSQLTRCVSNISLARNPICKGRQNSKVVVDIKEYMCKPYSLRCRSTTVDTTDVELYEYTTRCHACRRKPLDPERLC